MSMVHAAAVCPCVCAILRTLECMEDWRTPWLAWIALSLSWNYLLRWQLDRQPDAYCGSPQRARSAQTIGYAELLAALGLGNIRELEDLLITDCFHSGIVSGRLDQRQQCLQVRTLGGIPAPPSHSGCFNFAADPLTCDQCWHAPFPRLMIGL